MSNIQFTYYENQIIINSEKYLKEHFEQESIDNLFDLFNSLECFSHIPECLGYYEGYALNVMDCLGYGAIDLLKEDETAIPQLKPYIEGKIKDDSFFYYTNVVIANILKDKTLQQHFSFNILLEVLYNSASTGNHLIDIYLDNQEHINENQFCKILENIDENTLHAESYEYFETLISKYETLIQVYRQSNLYNEYTLNHVKELLNIGNFAMQVLEQIELKEQLKNF